MDLESLNSQFAALRDGDEALSCAFTELEDRMERWLAAMRADQTAVAEAWQQLAAVREAANAAMAAISEDVAPAVVVDEIALPEAAVAPATENETPTVETETAAAKESASEPPVPVEESEEADASVEESGPPISEEVAAPESAQPATESPGGMFKKPRVEADAEAPTEEEPASTEAVKPGSPEDDETLLATLDEQTLAAIRVKRRLHGSKRSVREILEELQKEKPAAKEKPQQRKSWWR